MTQKNERIARYSSEEIDRLRQAGADQTDWARVDQLTEDELERSIDEDEGEIDWDSIQVGIPGRKRQLTIRLDADVIEWFQSQGPGYQTRMNAVLRSFVAAQKRR